jgi:hypothetical protein
MTVAPRTLIALLVASTALFTVGAVAERSQSQVPTSAHLEQTEQPAITHEEGEPAAGGETTVSGTEGETHTAENEAVLGVDVESTPLIVLAVLAGLGLAGLVATRFGRLPGVLLAVALIALAWAALDVREIIHQLDESRTGIAAVAILVAALHATAALLAGRMAMSRPPSLVAR